MVEIECCRRIRNASVSVVLVLVLAVGTLVAADSTFVVGPVVAARSEVASGYLEVPGGVDQSTRIPISVVNGAAPGPVLALIAGTHGYEYPPILALQRVRRALDPAALSGVVVLVHVANLPSFLGRTIYYSPVDGKNLNRVYPGKLEGTVSERIAHAIFTEVISAADYVVDMHGGDGNEALRPYLYLSETGEQELDGKSRAMGLAFGLDTIVTQTEWTADPSAHIYTEWAALGLGKPAMTTETGSLGSTSEELVGLAERGVWNLLRHLGMVEGEPSPAPGIIWLEQGEVIRSPAVGMFDPAVEPGYFVAGGALLGTLRDLFGDPIEMIESPFAGVVNYVIATPPVNEGEPLAMVSRVASTD